MPNSSVLNGAQLVTSLPSVLAGAASNLAVARSVLVISVLELLALAVAALLAVARLLATQREAETALLIARGAARSQLTWLTAAEVVPLAALLSVVGAVAGSRLASVLVATGPLGRAGIRLAGPAGSWPDVLGTAIAVTAIAAVALLAPGFTLSPGAVRIRRGRQARLAATARAGLDIALVVLAVLAGWQLRRYSAASAGGTARIDPVLALALAAGSVATLRLLPLAARTADRLAARSSRLTTSLATWQFSWMPVRQGGAMLLLTMAVATGTLTLAQHASWLTSASDQAAFATGGDVQVDLPAPLEPGRASAVTAARGVTHAMAVAANQASPGEVIAVDAAQAAQVVRLRGDESPWPAGSLFRAITPAGALPGSVLTTARPGAIQLTATLRPAAPAATGRATGLALSPGPVTVALTILDRTGAAYQIAAGTLVAAARRHRLPLAPAAAPSGLHAQWIECADARARPPIVPIAVLGMLTIIGYGACYYAYGVLIGPIGDDTRWPDAALGAIFSATLAITGVGGMVAGRFLDRRGPRPVFLLAGIAGAGAMLLASVQGALLPFAIAYAVGCGLVGALGFYHITQAVAARTAPAAPARAIIWVTLFGAFSSPLFLPLTAWLTQSAGWRGAIRIEAVTVGVAFLLAAVMIGSAGHSQPGTPAGRPAGVLRAAWRSPPVRAWLAATVMGGAAVNALIVYQVPVTVRAGLPLGVAAAVAGFRGLAQLAGRLPLTALTSKLGARSSLVLAYTLAAAVTLLLFAGGALAAVLVLSLLAGAAIGAVYTLQGVYAYELIDPRHLGTLLGIAQAVFAAGGALGPLTAGALLGATRSYIPAITIISAGFAAAVGVLLLGRAPGPAAASNSAGQDRT